MMADDNFVTFRKALWLLVIAVGTVFAVQAADLYALETLGTSGQNATASALPETDATPTITTSGTYLPIADAPLTSVVAPGTIPHSQEAQVPNFAMVGDGGDLGQRARAVMQDEMPVILATKISDTAYVSLADIISRVGGELRWRPGDAEAILISPYSIAMLVPGSTQATIDLQPVTLSAAPVETNGKLMLPAKALDQVFGSKTTWDEGKKIFTIEDQDVTVHIVALEDIFQLEVSRSTRTLQVYALGKPVKAYPMCIGRGNNTPVGHFHIRSRAVWPPWRTYEGEYIPGGSGRNPLGARWLGTSARGHERGWTIGMHGTNQPSSIGKRISGGCMRMYNRDAIELFNNIPIGTRVWIHEEPIHLPDASTA